LRGAIAVADQLQVAAAVKRLKQILGGNLIGPCENAPPSGIFRGADKVRRREANTLIRNAIPIYPACGETSQSPAHRVNDSLQPRKLVSEHEVETAQDCRVQKLGQISSRNDERWAWVLLQELKEGIQDPAGFAYITSSDPVARKCINLVE
jgi:hypothetical protein